MRILHNAKIYPLTEKYATASAMLIDQGRILALGDEAHCLAWGGNPAKEDLGGRVVIPGLTDAHIHAIYHGCINLH